MKLRKYAAGFLAVILSFGLCACGKGEPGKQAENNETASTGTGTVRTDVVYGLTTDITTLDLAGSTDQISTILYRQLYDTLVEKDKDGNWVGKLAESWEISEDSCTYTFHLRKDVICHDGQPMTAKDVVFSIKHLMESAARGASMVNMKDCIEVDENTVQILLSSPYEPTLEVLLGCGRIASANTTDWDMNPIGTGPYKYVSRSSGENIILKAWDQYYLGEAKIKDITFKIITDSTTQIAALQKGELDFLTHAPLAAKNTVEDDKNLVWHQTNFRGNTWVAMCENKPPFDNILARKAVQYCVDKEAMLLGGTEGMGVINNTIFPATVQCSPEENYVPEYSYDMDKAKEYLEQYKAETGVSEVVISILAPTQETYLNPAITLEGMLRDVGFTVTTEQIDRSTFWSSLYAGNYQICVAGTSWPMCDADASYMYFYSTAGQNYFKINDSHIDELYAQGRQSTDKAERLEIYTNIQKEFDEKAICVPLYQYANAVIYNVGLQGVDQKNDLYQHYVYDWYWGN